MVIWRNDLCIMICMLLYLSDLSMVNVIVFVRGVPRCR